MKASSADRRRKADGAPSAARVLFDTKVRPQMEAFLAQAVQQSSLDDLTQPEVHRSVESTAIQLEEVLALIESGEEFHFLSNLSTALYYLACDQSFSQRVFLREREATALYYLLHAQRLTVFLLAALDSSSIYSSDSNTTCDDKLHDRKTNGRTLQALDRMRKFQSRVYFLLHEVNLYLAIEYLSDVIDSFANHRDALSKLISNAVKSNKARVDIPFVFVNVYARSAQLLSCIRCHNLDDVACTCVKQFWFQSPLRSCSCRIMTKLVNARKNHSSRIFETHGHVIPALSLKDLGHVFRSSSSSCRLLLDLIPFISCVSQWPHLYCLHYMVDIASVFVKRSPAFDTATAPYIRECHELLSLVCQVVQLIMPNTPSANIQSLWIKLLYDDVRGRVDGVLNWLVGSSAQDDKCSQAWLHLSSDPNIASSKEFIQYCLTSLPLFLQSHPILPHAECDQQWYDLLTCCSQNLYQCQIVLSIISQSFPLLMLSTRYEPLQTMYALYFLFSLLTLPTARFSLHSLIPYLANTTLNPAVIDCFRFGLRMIIPIQDLQFSSASLVAAHGAAMSVPHSHAVRPKRQLEVNLEYEPTNASLKKSCFSHANEETVMDPEHQYFTDLYTDLMDRLINTKPLPNNLEETKIRYTFIHNLLRIYLPFWPKASTGSATRDPASSFLPYVSLLRQCFSTLGLFMNFSSTLLHRHASMPSPSDAKIQCAEYLICLQLVLCDEMFNALAPSFCSLLQDDFHALLEVARQQKPLNQDVGPVSSSQSFTIEFYALVLRVSAHHCIVDSSFQSLLARALIHESSTVRLAGVYAMTVACQKLLAINGETVAQRSEYVWSKLAPLAHDPEEAVRVAALVAFGRMFCLASTTATITRHVVSELPSWVSIVEAEKLHNDSVCSHLWAQLDFRCLIGHYLQSPNQLLSADCLIMTCPVCSNHSFSTLENLLTDSKLFNLFDEVITTKSNTSSTRSAMVESFFCVVRHNSFISLLNREQGRGLPIGTILTIIPSQPTPSSTVILSTESKMSQTDLRINEIGRRFLICLLNEDANVRSIAREKFPWLLQHSGCDSCTTQTVSQFNETPFALLFADVQVCVDEHNPLAVCSSPEQTMNNFLWCIQCYTVSDQYLDSTIWAMSMIAPFVCLEAQAPLLWWLVLQHAQTSEHFPPLDSCISTAFKRICNALQCTPLQLFDKHSEYLYQNLIRYEVAAATDDAHSSRELARDCTHQSRDTRRRLTLMNKLCDHLQLAEAPAAFVSHALSRVLPQLILASGTEPSMFFSTLAVLSEQTLRNIILANLHNILYHLYFGCTLEGQDSSDDLVETTLGFLLHCLDLPSQPCGGYRLLVPYCGGYFLKELFSTYGRETQVDFVLSSERNTLLDRHVYWTLLALDSESSQEALCNNIVNYPHLAKLLQRQFLFLYDEFKKIILSKLVSISSCQQAVWSFCHLLRLLKDNLGSFVPKIVSLLKTVMNIASGVVSDSSSNSLFVSIVAIKRSVIKTWEVFITGLGFHKLGEYINQFVLILAKLVEPTGDNAQMIDGQSSIEWINSDVVSLLTWILVEHKEDIKVQYINIPLWSHRITQLASLRSLIKEQQPSRSLFESIKHLLSLLSSDSAEVRTVAAEQLRDVLIEKSQNICALALEGEFQEIVTSLVSSLLVKCNDTHVDVRFLAAECLGELGAIDPGQLRVDALALRPNKLIDDQHFARFIISDVLVPALKAAQTPAANDIVMYAIQETLKVVFCNENITKVSEVEPFKAPPKNTSKVTDGTRNLTAQFWRSLSTTTLDLIEPCIGSTYVKAKNAQSYASAPQEKLATGVEQALSVNIIKRPPIVCSENAHAAVVEPELPSTASLNVVQSPPHHRPWLLSWTHECINQTSGSRQTMFFACQGVVYKDESAARKLLPYVIENIMQFGSNEQVARVTSEILDTLSQACDSPISNESKSVDRKETADLVNVHVQRNTQVVFEVLDSLSSWIHEEVTEQCRLDNVHGSSSNMSASAQKSGVPVGSPIADRIPLSHSTSIRSLLDRKKILDEIPKKLLADAAFACQAYTRALKYFESYLSDKRVAERQKAICSTGPAANEAALAPQPGKHIITSSKMDTIKKSRILPCSNMSDGLTVADLLLLQRLYSSMDESDGMQGIAALRSDTSLEEQIRDCRSLGLWSDALTCYDQGLSTPSRQGERITEFHHGYLDCLLNLGRWNECITYVQGIVPSVSAELKSSFTSYAVQAAWRLGDWDKVESLLKVSTEDSFQVHLAKIFLALHKNDESAYQQALHTARRSVMGNLSAASYESYQRAYTFCSHLHCLQEIERAKCAAKTRNLDSLAEIWRIRLQRTIPSFRVREPILSVRRTLYDILNVGASVGNVWLRLSIEARNTGQYETAQSALLRAKCFHVDDFEIQCAKLMKARGHHDQAIKYLDREFTYQRQLIEGVIEATNSSTSWSMHSSQMINGNLSHGLTSTGDKVNGTSVRWPPKLARMSLNLGKWHRELANRSLHNIQRYLVDATTTITDWEKGKYRLAQYYDACVKGAMEHQQQNHTTKPNQLAQHHPKESNAETGTGKDEYANVDRKPVPEKLLRVALISFVDTLSLGHRYLFQCLPRLLNLYLEQTELTRIRDSTLLQKMHEKHVNKRTNRQNSTVDEAAVPSDSLTLVDEFVAAGYSLDIIHSTMKNAIEKIAPHKWYTALSQLLSRLEHPNPFTLNVIMNIIDSVLYHHHQQAIWSIYPVFMSKNKARRERIKAISSRVDARFQAESTPESKKKAKEVACSQRVIKQLIAICQFEPSKDVKKLSVKQHFKTLSQLNITGSVLIPIQSALTISLPNFHDALSGASVDVRSSTSNSIPAFASHQIMIDQFENDITILSSKERPKKIFIRGIDGRSWPFLCKHEGKSDMRKTSRVMELCDVINRLLNKHNESRTRQLHLRTFAALSLTEECGLIEWVHNTTTFRLLMKSVHDRMNIQLDNRAIKAEYEPVMKARREHKLEENQSTKRSERGRDRNTRRGLQREEEDELDTTPLPIEMKVFRKMVDQYPAVFHQWFLQAYSDPTSWFRARLTYTRSAAVWSMLGSVIGLGDRHAENIMIDTSNGECVHVDFDCLFGKGLTLDTPEVVPFRLTQNVVDGFGLSGVEGVFRRCCEVAMGVMRENIDTLENVLQSCLYDPLLDWKRGSVDYQDKSDLPLPSHLHAQAQNDPMVEEEASSRAIAAKKLLEVHLKLSGVVNPRARSDGQVHQRPLSTNGQVDALIRDATSESLLSMMYMGWMAWL